eukprot:PhF_6_TR26640/c0_g1_i1/m.38594
MPKLEDLGQPVQDLIHLIGEDLVSEADLDALTKISVKQLAKVYEMLSDGEDAAKILAWLRRVLNKVDDAYQNERKKKAFQGAARNPFQYFREMEEKARLVREQAHVRAEARKAERLKYAKQREEVRLVNILKVTQEKKQAVFNKEGTTALTRLPGTAQQDIINVFETFVTKHSLADNSEKNYDNEWWKQEQYRRDYEEKGKSWSVVRQGGGVTAPEQELATRVDFYKSVLWWRETKYWSNWEQTRLVEFWKETMYIRDWMVKGLHGVHWTGSDEDAAFSGKGRTYSADTAELKRRIQWYTENKPLGIVCLWSALGPGLDDRCPINEKREREDWYRNGDWWKQCGTVPLDDLRFSGPAGADRIWWKQELYRRDFENQGIMWSCANEVAVLRGHAKDTQCTDSEKAKRTEWFTTNWWKSQPCIDDYNHNRDKGSLWRLKESDGFKLATALELRERELWYKSCEDREWWKHDRFMRDFFVNGESGNQWNSAIQDFPTLRASEAERRIRSSWYQSNWWKAEKYCHAFYLDSAGSISWKVTTSVPYDDLDWWKADAYRVDWKKSTDESKVEFWMRGWCLHDYDTLGENGRSWMAVDEVQASLGRGKQSPASTAEIQRRRTWLQGNWWMAPRLRRDWARGGQEWSARASNDHEIVRRIQYYSLRGTSWRALTENDGVSRDANAFPCTDMEALDRSDWYAKFWWKSRECISDYEDSDGGAIWKSATEEIANRHLGEIEGYTATEEELQKRIFWYENCSDLEFWKDPTYIEDYLNKGNKWKRRTPSGLWHSRRTYGKDTALTQEEIMDRTAWYEGNSWKLKTTKDDPHVKVFLGLREIVNEPELNVRADYYRSQLKDSEYKLRRAFMEKLKNDHKRIQADEVDELLEMLNQSIPISDVQKNVFRQELEKIKQSQEFDSTNTISQDDFLAAVAESGIYVPPTQRESQLLEEEIIDSMQVEEVAREEEEAAFLMMEAQEELDAAAPPGEIEETDTNNEESHYLEEAKRVIEPNEDDVPPSDKSESKYEELIAFLRDRESACITSDQIRETFEYFKDPTFSGRNTDDVITIENLRTVGGILGCYLPSYPDWTVNPVNYEQFQTLVKQAQVWVNRRAVVQVYQLLVEKLCYHYRTVRDDEEEMLLLAPEDTSTFDLSDLESFADQPLVENSISEPIPIKTMNAIDFPHVDILKGSYLTIKYVSGSRPNKDSVCQWIVDLFSKSITLSSANGAHIFYTFFHHQLQSVNRSLDHPRLLEVNVASKRFTFTLPTNVMREKMYDALLALNDLCCDLSVSSGLLDAGAIRQKIHVVCTAKDELVDNTGLELHGEVDLHCTRLNTEVVSITLITHDLRGLKPMPFTSYLPSSSVLSDVIVITVQNAIFETEDGEWFEEIKRQLPDTCAAIYFAKVKDLITIICCVKHLVPRISNFITRNYTFDYEGVEPLGRGGLFVGFTIEETSFGFLCVHLHGRSEFQPLRIFEIETLMDACRGWDLGLECSHQSSVMSILGNFNCRVDDGSDEFESWREDGFLGEYQEEPIKFPPTYRSQHHTDRILLKCQHGVSKEKSTQYNSIRAPEYEHDAVRADYVVKIQRHVWRSDIKILVFQRISVTLEEGSPSDIMHGIVTIHSLFGETVETAPLNRTVTQLCWEGGDVLPSSLSFRRGVMGVALRDLGGMFHGAGEFMVTSCTQTRSSVVLWRRGRKVGMAKLVFSVS